MFANAASGGTYGPLVVGECQLVGSFVMPPGRVCQPPDCYYTVRAPSSGRLPDAATDPAPDAGAEFARRADAGAHTDTNANPQAHSHGHPEPVTNGNAQANRDARAERGRHHLRAAGQSAGRGSGGTGRGIRWRCWLG